MAKASKKPTPRAKTGTFSYAAPGQPSTRIKFKVGEKLNDIFGRIGINLSGFEVTVNGAKASLEQTISNNDVVRVGVMTKHG